MNERRILRLVADLLLEYLEEDKQNTIEHGDLKQDSIVLDLPEQNIEEKQTAPSDIPQDTQVSTPIIDNELEIKNREIERLKEELSKAQLNSFNFQPIGGTNG